MASDQKTRLYLITPPQCEIDNFKKDFTAVLDAAPIACVQLRLKNAADDTWKRAIETLMPLAHARDIAFLVNDRADMAKAFGCDGVHIGKDDVSYQAARALLGKQAIIGTSCYASKDAAMDAASAGTDYVAFGSVFPSATKEDAPLAPLSLLEDWVFISDVPCAAIGGINAENCAPLVEAGVDFLAVISAVWQHPLGPVTGIKAMHQAITG